MEVCCWSSTDEAGWLLVDVWWIAVGSCEVIGLRLVSGMYMLAGSSGLFVAVRDQQLDDHLVLLLVRLRVGW